MQHAAVLQSGFASHPESGRAALRILVDAPYSAQSNMTYLWVDPACPEPKDTETVSWDARRVQTETGWWRKVEQDSDPNKTAFD